MPLLRYSPGPFTVPDFHQPEFSRIELNVFNSFTHPGIYDVHHSIAGLYHGRVGILVDFRILKDSGCIPVLSIFRNRKIQRGSVSFAGIFRCFDMVIYQQMAPVGEAYAVKAGIIIVLVLAFFRFPSRTEEIGGKYNASVTYWSDHTELSYSDESGLHTSSYFDEK